MSYFTQEPPAVEIARWHLALKWRKLVERGFVTVDEAVRSATIAYFAVKAQASFGTQTR